MASVKKQIRDAVFTVLDGNTDAAFVGMYGAEIINEARQPAIMISVSMVRHERLSNHDDQGILATLSLRLVGKAPTEIGDDDTAIDVLENIEAQIHDLLSMGADETDPLGLGLISVYFDSVAEPLVDDAHETPVAVIQIVYGLMMRVDRLTLNTIT